MSAPSPATLHSGSPSVSLDMRQPWKWILCADKDGVPVSTRPWFFDGQKYAPASRQSPGLR